MTLPPATAPAPRSPRQHRTPRPRVPRPRPTAPHPTAPSETPDDSPCDDGTEAFDDCAGLLGEELTTRSLGQVVQPYDGWYTGLTVLSSEAELHAFWLAERLPEPDEASSVQQWVAKVDVDDRCDQCDTGAQMVVDLWVTPRGDLTSCRTGRACCG